MRFFILSAGIILLAAALCRFLIAAGHAQILALPDPILGISLRNSVIAVGAFELVVALICLFGRRVGFQIGWLAWLATSYIVFWFCLLALHDHPQGTCIGILTDPLWLYHGITGHILGLIPFGLVLGSYAAVFSLWFSADARTVRLAGARRPAARQGEMAELMKMSCPACGGHVQFPAQKIGQQMSCPHCQVAIALRKPDEYLKMSCGLCGGHVEFPPHAVGQKIYCPHCATPITLLNPV